MSKKDTVTISREAAEALAATVGLVSIKQVNDAQAELREALKK